MSTTIKGFTGSIEIEQDEDGMLLTIHYTDGEVQTVRPDIPK